MYATTFARLAIHEARSCPAPALLFEVQDLYAVETGCQGAARASVPSVLAQMAGTPISGLGPQR
jgi:hypothetical protein